MGLTIDISVDDGSWSVLDDMDGLAERAAAAVVAISPVAVPSDAELSLVLSNDAFVRGLNQRWRGKDSPTNVLSFPTFGSGSKTMLGDIVVAYETSAREASEHGRPLADYLTHLIVHGIFHLIGFDHENESDADVMERLESRALTMLDIASPYEDTEDLRVHR